jgi:hypothetical protein
MDREAIGFAIALPALIITTVGLAYRTALHAGMKHARSQPTRRRISAAAEWGKDWRILMAVRVPPRGPV